MLTARKAKIKTQRSINREQRRILSEIESRIKLAIRYGIFSISGTNDLNPFDPAIKLKLEKLGYTIESTECSWCIKWN